MQSTPINGEPVLAGTETDPTDPLEQLRARLVLSIGQHDATVAAARRQIAAITDRPDVKPQALVSDLRVLTHRITEGSAVRWALRELLADVDELSGRERGDR